MHQFWQIILTNLTCTHVPQIPITRVNPSAVTEDITETPLEIAATNVNNKAFAHYEENTTRRTQGRRSLNSWSGLWQRTHLVQHSCCSLSQYHWQRWLSSRTIRQCIVWWKTLNELFWKVNNHAILGFNLLQTLAFKGESVHLAFLLERG